MLREAVLTLVLIGVLYVKPSYQQSFNIRNLTTLVGSTAYFYALLETESGDNGTWYKNGIQLQPTNRIRMFPSGRARQLTISNAEFADAGLYTLEVNNVRQSAWLNIYGPTIVSGLQDQSVQEGATVALEVEISETGVPDNRIQWELNRTLLTDNARIRRSVNGRFHRLTISNVQTGDAGEYKFTVDYQVSFMQLRVIPSTPTDVNECQTGANNCSPNAFCTNTIGSYVCTCNTGWNGDGRTCSDINECTTGGSNCSPFAQCQNTQGSFTCTCRNGYSGDGVSCVDINECTTGRSNCSPFAQCQNTQGSFTCTCRNGYSGNGVSCVDINECGTSPCSINADCTNTQGSFTCACKSGFTGNGFTCNAPTDVNECQTGANNCNANADCANTIGSFTCTCRTGWFGDGVTCRDINECTTGSNNCSPFAQCQNTQGSFICTCRNGYSGNGVSCVDINECTTGRSNCSPFAQCQNTQGSFICTCRNGYSGNGVSCVDINECGTSPCSINADCTNTQGSFTCACKSGFTGNGFTCNAPTDVNECQTGANNCNANADCANTIGSFTCTCRTGWFGDGVTCRDINECTTGSNNCSPFAQCQNTQGSFICTCRNGYSGNGVSCVDINECTTGRSNCSPFAQCQNTQGSFICTCRNGYSGNGVSCVDIDECTSGRSNCSPFAQCRNTQGSFTCTCLSGYSGNGVTCVDLNECLLGTNNCDINADCSNTFGSFTCRCRSGWSGDGTTCRDIDECSAGTSRCNINADCINTQGSYTCTCKSGFTGDGFTCTAPTAVTIITPMNNVTTRLGTFASFQVVLSQDAVGGVWYKEGVPVVNTSSVLTYNSGQFHYLAVFNARASDQGRYSFQIAGQTTVGYLTVTGIPNLAIVVPLAPSVPPVGGFAEFSVQLNQDNVQNGVWYKDGVRLVNSTKTLITVNGRTQRLVVNNIGAADTGTYSYIVNGLTTSSQLTVQGVTGWGEWMAWTGPDECSTTCDNGVRSQFRERVCVNRSLGCRGEQFETRTLVCNRGPCAVPINGQWSQWNLVVNPSCGITCGSRTDVFQERRRECNNPPPSNGGQTCPGSNTDRPQKSCTFPLCPAPTEDLCSNTQRSSGVGYRYHPTDCDKYIQCYYNSNGNVVGVYRSCPFGLYWDQRTFRCDKPWKVTCPIERCSGKCTANYGLSGSCRSYWQCSEGLSVAKCCMSGFMYEEGQGCRPNFFCRDTCPTACVDSDVCNKRPVFSADRAAYNISVGLLGWLEARCNVGTYFDVADCGCSALNSSCRADYDITFSDLNFLNNARASWLRDENVTIANGIATFQSNSYFFANITKNTSTPNCPIIIKFRYRETTTVSGRRVLVSTSNCRKGNSLVIAIDNDFITFEVTSWYDNLVKLPISTAGYPRTSWKTVTFMYNGYEMMASIESDRVKYSARVGATTSSIMECGLRVGTDGTTNIPTFIGELDWLTVYRCDPGNVL